jgi:O-Antigen ligase
MSTIELLKKDGEILPNLHSNLAKKERPSFSLFLVYTMWMLLLFQPEAFLASFGASPLKYAPTLLLPLLMGVVLVKANRSCWYWPMMLLLISHTIILPFVTNRGYAMDPFRVVVYFYVLLMASLATIDSVQKVSFVLTMYLIQFIWWAINGLPGGRVSWHSEFGNEDGFGPLMVVGMAFAGSYTMGGLKKGLRGGGLIAALLCTVGLVASTARGAFLSASVVLAALWFRSHRKSMMLACILLIGGSIFITSNILFSKGTFWAEMSSSFDGFDDPTGRDRGDLWWAGWEVFTRAPLIGVGPNNFGSYAAENFKFGDAPGFYADPNHLYGRHLHNIFVQVLAEQGLCGVALFLFILVDFVRRNKQLRATEAIEYWEKAIGGHLDLRAVSLGLEGAMIGFLATGLFYNQLYNNMFYSVIILNVILHSVTKPARTASRVTVGTGEYIPPDVQHSTVLAHS